jgi:E3 ubiquitin-protein ligase DRIP
MRKLDLKSEDEVEITCMGEPVIPTLQLHSLVDLWLETTSKHQRVAASIGSSAKEFVMVLVYSRKLPECNN